MTASDVVPRFLASLFLFTALTISPNPIAAADSSQPIWKDGDLVAPLPADPAVRAAAIAQARQRASDRAAAPGAASVRGFISPPVAPSGHVDLSTFVGRPAVPHPNAERARMLEMIQRREEAAIEAAGKRIDTSTAPQPGTSKGSVTTAPQQTLATGAIATYDGIADTGQVPPTPSIAVGPGHVVLTATDWVEIRDRCNNVLVSEPFETLFGQPSNLLYYSGQVLYDEWNNRWMIAFIGNDAALTSSTIYIAVSTSQDPTGGWCTYSFSVDAFTGGFADDMRITVDPDVFYVAATTFDLNTYALQGGYVFWGPTTQMYSCSGFTYHYFPSITYPGTATPVVGMRPAKERTFAGAEYFAATRYAGGSAISVWTATDPLGSYTFSGNDVSVVPYTSPPNIQQPDLTYVKTGDARATDAAYASGILYVPFTSTTSAPLVYPGVTVALINPNSLSSLTQYFISFATYMCAYPEIDIDANGAFTTAYVTGGPSEYLSLDYTTSVWTGSGVNLISGGTLASGLANYADGIDTGTSLNPYRWGYFTGLARDPVDDRTMWAHGPIASNNPIPSWETKVALTSAYQKSNLSLTPVSTQTFWGYTGGPFSPDTTSITLTNTGGVSADWCVAVPAWLDVSPSSGHIAPGGSQVVTLHVDDIARTYTAGAYNGVIAFTNYSGSGDYSVIAYLLIGNNGQCEPASQEMLWPASGAPLVPWTNDENGVFVTAIHDAQVCAVGVYGTFNVPQSLTVRIYHANGTTRGSLMASDSYSIVDPNATVHYVPLNVTLSACQDYDVAFQVTGTPTVGAWSEVGLPEPFDIGGMVRVRDGEHAGDASATTLPALVLQLAPQTCDTVDDLSTTLGTTPAVTADAEEGVYVHVTRSLHACKVGWEASLVPGTVLTAHVYNANGSTRGNLIGGGSTIVSTSGTTFHDVPVEVNLLAGHDYNISFTHQNIATWFYYFGASFPYDVTGFGSILNGSYGSGNVDPTRLAHVRVTDGDPIIGGTPFDLAKQNDVYPPPYAAASLPIVYGLYVQPQIDTQVYSIGLMADVAVGQPITAEVYAASGTTRGSLISSTTVTSDAAGMRWHDVPVSAAFAAFADYDIAFNISNVDHFSAWAAVNGLPYTAYGWLTVNAAESGGVVSSTLIHMRLNACNETATPVADHPRRTPTFLSAPAPNPAGDRVAFGYSLASSGPLDMSVYDVTGRLVAHVESVASAAAGPGRVEFDTHGLASGVYFVRMKTPAMTMSRKFVVTH